MAKEVSAQIKLQIPAGKANPAPPVGPSLGQHGVNIMEFCKQFNAKTQKEGDSIIPVIITVYKDRSFTFIMKTPPASLDELVNGDPSQKIVLEDPRSSTPGRSRSPRSRRAARGSRTASSSGPRRSRRSSGSS